VQQRGDEVNTLYAKIVNDDYYICLDCGIEQDGVLVDVAQERNEYDYVCDVCNIRRETK
jgi:DNA-directed RNA polymerase subunit RPC12/RpoP